MTHPLLNPEVIRAVEREAAGHLGRPWAPTGFTGLNQRASCPAGIFSARSLPVFAKLRDSGAGPEPVIAELRGFRLIRSLAPEVPVPVPVGAGMAATLAGTLLLSEALPERGDLSGLPADSRTPEDYAAIGRTLARLHRVRGEAFGLADFDGYFGPFPQCNQPVSSGRWPDFFAERRLLPMLRDAVDSGRLPDGLARGVERIAARLPALCGPEPEPALLHGDAQQNNFVSTSGGAAVIDAAPYYGHPEADLALVDNYSPVDPALFRAYEEITPIGPGFAQRRELWRLPSYLAIVVAVEHAPFGRPVLPRIDAAVRQYA